MEERIKRTDELLKESQVKQELLEQALVEIARVIIKLTKVGLLPS